MKCKLSALASAFTLAAGLALPLQLNAEEPAAPLQGPAASASSQAQIAPLQNGDIVNITSGQFIDEKQLTEDISKARVIYIGETHDNVMAHIIQAKIIEVLARRYPGQIAVGMEMFRRSAQPELDEWHNGKMPPAAFEKLFEREWGFDDEIYRPILDMLEKAGIPIIALRPSEEMEQKFSRGEPGNYPEMDQNDALHREFIMQILASFAGAHGHGAADAAKLEKHYQKQLLRDEVMGQTVATFLADPANKDKKLVVIAGNVHVQYGLGIPKRADRRVPHDYTIILAEEGDLSHEINRVANGRQPDIPPAGNYVWKIPYVDLEQMHKNRQKMTQGQPAPPPMP